ncbi:outer membrane beta-barrel protein [Taibaiella chishuiensis]|uniref:Outer membrane protein with beta-barrel domain n=1 Tax=Taibaiella chishuiensis TaxID=1434707 RepID=A0A2P8DBL7_9BACT|nr:outer membrane beta-barrel protein [Taibaiella chishuiensis]PSK94602.1 outer membrane protein with beta-barrel domain [Taibaiella chishuiensis]
MKRTLTLFTALSLLAGAASAQDTIIDTAVAKPAYAPVFGVSVGGGMTFAFTDVKESKSAPVFGAGIQYTPLPWLGINLDLQYGTLKAGDRSKAEVSNMEFKNNYFYGALTGRVYPLRLLPEPMAARYLGGLYAGVGLGFISSKPEAFATTANGAGLVTDADGMQIVLPVELGYNLPLAHLDKSQAAYSKSLLSLNIGYRHNFAFSDKLDGYTPTWPSNKNKDAFSTIFVALVYNF